MCWLVLAASGALVDPARRRDWSRAGWSVVQAHAASVVLKRVFRRARPPADRRRTAVRSEWTFPSSHATGSAAAVVALAGLVPVAVTGPVALGVSLSRVVLRVHHRRDVLAGALLGAAMACRRRRAPASLSRG